MFCSQAANFQTRSMLIPYDKYLLCDELKKDFIILQKHSKSHKFNINGKEYFVDNLLINNIIWNGKQENSEEFEYTKIISDLLFYAQNNYPECGYLRTSDKIWCDHIIGNLCTGCNHVMNYCNLRNMESFQQKPIKIVMGFLVLEMDNGKFRFPLVVGLINVS